MSVNINLGPRRKAKLEILTMSEPLCAIGSNLRDIIYRVHKMRFRLKLRGRRYYPLRWGHKYIRLHDVQGDVEEIEIR